jgi:hypothetical protein
MDNCCCECIRSSITPTLVNSVPLTSTIATTVIIVRLNIIYISSHISIHTYFTQCHPLKEKQKQKQKQRKNYLNEVMLNIHEESRYLERGMHSAFIPNLMIVSLINIIIFFTVQTIIIGWISILLYH